MDKMRKKRIYCFACGNSTAASYFRFPLKENLRRQWLQKCNLVGRDVPATAKLCENHFSPQSYSDGKKGESLRRRLRQTAIPQLYVPVQRSIDSVTVRESGGSETVTEQRNESVDNEGSENGSVRDENTRGKKSWDHGHCFICGSVRIKSCNMFYFPTDECRRKVWFDIIGTCHVGRPSMTSRIRLCDRHFSPTDITYYPRSGVHRLKPNAVPLKSAVGGTEVLTNEAGSSECTSTMPTAEDEDVTMVVDIGEGSVEDPSVLPVIPVEVVVSSDMNSSLDNRCDRRDKACQVPQDVCSVAESSVLPDASSTPSSSNRNSDGMNVTTPTCRPRRVPTSLSDHRYAQHGSGRVRRVLTEPRYIGDVHTPHLSTPRRARRCFEMSKKVICKQRTTIDQMARKLRDAQRRVRTLGEVISHLRNTAALNETSANNLSVCSS